MDGNKRTIQPVKQDNTFAKILLYSLINMLLMVVLHAAGLVSIMVFPLWFLISWVWILLAVALKLNRFWADVLPLAALGAYFLLDWFLLEGNAHDWGGIAFLFAIQFLYSRFVLNAMR